MARSRKKPIRKSKARIRRVATARAPVVAAVDLGSNSFHLVIAQIRDGAPFVVDRAREMLRFGSALDHHGKIRPESAKAALLCLRRFGQHLALWRPQLVRAVGTNTLRVAAQSDDFLARAEERLGAPISVISGVEEARLIYRGVSPGLAGNERVLLIDVGGGSTEIVVGEGSVPQVMESVTLGSVTLTDEVFTGHLLSETRFAQAVKKARARLMTVHGAVMAAGWTRVMGSSGTVRAVESMVRDSGLAERGLRRAHVEEVIRRLIAQRRIDRLVMPGLATERAPVIMGGLAVLMAVFDVFGVDTMEVSRGALREGILYDLIDQMQGQDVRSAAVTGLAERWPTPMGEDVAHGVTQFAGSVAAAWSLTDEDRRFLEWGARLHGCGEAIAHTRFHLHSAYIVRSAELAGFSRHQQDFLGALIELHRGRWSGSNLRSLKGLYGGSIIRLAALLRLAVATERMRAAYGHLTVHLNAQGARLRIHVTMRSGIQRAAALADLAEECAQMAKSGIRFALD